MLCRTGFETCEKCETSAAEVESASIHVGDGACGTL